MQTEKKRVKQELSTAQTLTAGNLEQAAMLRNDESVLVHIRGKDCVAVEARDHKRCYRAYTKCLTRKAKNIVNIGPKLYDNAFDKFCIRLLKRE
jgi:hypothetical protein